MSQPIDHAQVASRVLTALEDLGEAKGMTPGVLARAAGLSRGYIPRAKREGMLSLRSLYLLCDVLGVDPKDVLLSLDEAREAGQSGGE